jgi:hypothetical protein
MYWSDGVKQRKESFFLFDYNFKTMDVFREMCL